MGRKTNSELSTKQRAAINVLADGMTLVDAALAIGMHHSTLYRWMEQAEFVAELRSVQRRAATEHMMALGAELTRNRSVMTGARDDTEASWSIRLRAAQALEDSLLKWRDHTDFEERLAALEANRDGK